MASDYLAVSAYCAAADVTIDRIRNLIAVTGTEPLIVDFKKGGSTREVTECTAAIANAHGGLILIGITDKEREVVGVPREVMGYVADVLATHLTISVSSLVAPAASGRRGLPVTH